MSDCPKKIYVPKGDLVDCEKSGLEVTTISSVKEAMCDNQVYYHESEVKNLKKELCDFLIFINKKHQNGEIEMPSYAILRMLKLKEEVYRCREKGIEND